MTDTASTNEVPIQQQLADDLRAFADWIETRPEIAEAMRWGFGPVYAFALSTVQWQAMLREAGSFTKSSDERYLNATIDVREHIKVQLTINKEQTCERRQVGEREVQREVYPEGVEPIIVTDTEPVYEWICPPSWIGER